MTRRIMAAGWVLGASFLLMGCEEEIPPSIDIKIVEREDFTYSAGYSNGCRFKFQVMNNTDDQLGKLEAFVLEDEKFLFSVSGELPPRGALTRTTDVQQNKRCREINAELGLRKNSCTLGARSQDECFTLVNLVIPE